METLVEGFDNPIKKRVSFRIPLPRVDKAIYLIIQKLGGIYQCPPPRDIQATDLWGSAARKTISITKKNHSVNMSEVFTTTIPLNFTYINKELWEFL